MATRSARRRKRRELDKTGRVVLIKIKAYRKPYYEISIGRVVAVAEWRENFVP